MISIRPAAIEDAAALSELYTANWPFLQPWEPVRDDTFLTVEGQRARIHEAETNRRVGVGCRYVIQAPDASGADGIIGMVSLSAIERGPAQSAHLGYWVAQNANGRGVATQAAALMLRVAFEELGLHRVEAGTLVHNIGSQKVLERNGFERIGLARAYLHIAGRWQDHILFQRLAPAAGPLSAD
jgi:[ribosomal protein S5]-alanine N-acetyltransferase